MEIAGLAVGIAGLAGLFGACMGAMKHLHSYKTPGHESSYIIAAFDADKLLFQRCAEESTKEREAGIVLSLKNLYEGMSFPYQPAFLFIYLLVIHAR